MSQSQTGLQFYFPDCLPGNRRSNQDAFQKLKRLQAFEDDFLRDGELAQAYLRTCVVLSIRTLGSIGSDDRLIFIPYAHAYAAVSCQLRRPEFDSTRLGCLVLALRAALEENDWVFENQIRGATGRYARKAAP